MFYIIRMGGKYSTLNKDNIMNEILWWIKLIAGIVGLVAAAGVFENPKQDKRFKTGFKDNEKPKSFQERLPALYTSLICGGIVFGINYFFPDVVIF